MSPDIEEVCQIAQNLARNCNYFVFPCKADKRPACPGGFKAASNEPGAITQLWRRWPGQLVGVATGDVSNIAVVDVDRKHREARQWWRANCSRLLPSRTYETRSGGLHVYYRHPGKLQCSTGKVCKGVDIRANGGYIVFWFATGLACLDHTTPASFPAWLLTELTKPPPEPKRSAPLPDADQAVHGFLRYVAQARSGERNSTLFWAACRLTERGLGPAAVEGLLISAATEAGLDTFEAKRTIASATRRVVA